MRSVILFSAVLSLLYFVYRTPAVIYLSTDEYKTLPYSISISPLIFLTLSCWFFISPLLSISLYPDILYPTISWCPSSSSPRILSFLLLSCPIVSFFLSPDIFPTIYSPLWCSSVPPLLFINPSPDVLISSRMFLYLSPVVHLSLYSFPFAALLSISPLFILFSSDVLSSWMFLYLSPVVQLFFPSHLFLAVLLSFP